MTSSKQTIICKESSTETLVILGPTTSGEIVYTEFIKPGVPPSASLLAIQLFACEQELF